MLRSEREAHERAGGCAFVAHAFALKQGRPPPPPPLPTRPSSPSSPGAAAAASAAAPTTATAAATKSAAVPGPPDLALLLEYHPGGDLAQLLARRRAGPQTAAATAARLDEREARFVAACALLALEALHSGGCIHRDVKPANLFVSRSGYAVLGDLGCAAVLPRAAPTPSMALVAAAAALAPARSPPGVPAAAAGPLTAAAAPAPWCIYGGRHCSAVSGTRGYMAPEVAASAGASAAPAPHGAAKAYGAAADLYSLGVALYELASGERPTPLVVAAVAAAASGETARGGTSAAAAGGETAAGADETAAGARAPPSPAEPILDPFPAHFSAGLRALLGALLSRDPARRPTAAGAQGAAWFAAFNWAALRGGTMSPPAALLAAAADGLGLSASEGTV
jgi:serine/threonine protein kinase